MKLFLSILFIVLITILISVLLAFLFLMLLPSLKNQAIDVDCPQFSDEEINSSFGNVDFSVDAKGVRVKVVPSADGCAAKVEEDREYATSTGRSGTKKIFPFLEKCYKIIIRKK